MTAQNEDQEAAEVDLRWGLRIQMRDGVRLSATAYLPAKQGAPVPAIFTLTPYIAQSFHDRGIYFASRGYVFFAVDVRGRGESEGQFQLRGEGRDGHDIVEWLAQQPYCNGKVAMWGGSYQGYTQWATAKEFPPHLMTIVPVAAPYRGVDSPIRNNIVATHRLQWLHMVAGRTLQDRSSADQSFWNHQYRRWFESGTAFDQIDRMLGMPSSLFQEWLSHPDVDTYWDSLNPSAEQYAWIRLPVLTLTGSYDADQPGALSHYREHLRNNPDATHYLVIGPWDHAGTRTPRAEFGGLKFGPASLVDLPGLHAAWYAWTMAAGAKPPFLQKRVAYYVMGAEQWRYADTLEAVTARFETLYLRSTANPTDVFASGALVEDEPPVSSVPAHYVYEPCDHGLAELESTVDPGSLVDQRMLHARIGKQLIYHSKPFLRATEVSGFFKLTLWLAIDQPDTDFQVAIYEIALDGSAIQLTTDIMRARYRESLREQHLIDTREPLHYDFERFTFVARRICKGHRLRLVVGPLNSIFSQKNSNAGGVVSRESINDARAVKVTLFHDLEHPSALYVPIGPPS